MAVVKRFTLYLTFGAAFSGMAVAQTAPDLDFTAGGDSASVQLTQEGDGVWGVSTGTEVTLNNGITFKLNSIQVNSDPYVFYSFSVQNTSTVTMPYTATIPVVPAVLPSGPYLVSSSLGVTLTDANPSAAVWISPVPAGPGTVQQGLIGGNDAGVDLDSITVSNSSFGSTTTTNFSAGPKTYTLGSSATDISMTESFDLSPGASVGLSGFFNVETVPEPSAWVLGALALLAFGVIRARRARG
jgi:MYXO-CTERM domain-containing protein